jgi:hypothetical protein
VALFFIHRSFYGMRIRGRDDTHQSPAGEPPAPHARVIARKSLTLEDQR